MSTKKTNLNNHLTLHFVVVILGFTGILGALVTISSLDLVWYRMLIAFAGLGLFVLIRPSRVRIPSRELLKIAGNGLLIALHWITFFEAIKISTVSVTLACIASTSFFVAFLEPLFFNRRIIMYEVILGLVVILGLYMIFKFETQYSLGISYALLSALLAALFGVINGQFVKKYPATIITLFEMLAGFAGISIYLVASRQFDLHALVLTPLDLLWLLLLGLVCTSFAFVVQVNVMKRLSPYTVSSIINMEPIYAIILALICFWEKEMMTSGFYLGTAIILSTVFANTWLKQRTKKEKRQP